MRGLTRVSIGLETTREELEAVEHVFSSADIRVLVDPEIARFSVDSPWVMYITAPLADFASRFSGANGEAPETAWTGIKAFIEGVSGAFRRRAGSLVFTDDDSEAIIALTPDLPDEAFAELLRLDLMEIEGKRISWDPDETGWCTLSGEPCPKR
jgi:hypothetical protein